jgi:hypothetical protein
MDLKQAHDDGDGVDGDDDAAVALGVASWGAAVVEVVVRARCGMGSSGEDSAAVGGGLAGQSRSAELMRAQRMWEAARAVRDGGSGPWIRGAVYMLAGLIPPTVEAHHIRFRAQRRLAMNRRHLLPLCPGRLGACALSPASKAPHLGSSAGAL